MIAGRGQGGYEEAMFRKNGGTGKPEVTKSKPPLAGNGDYVPQ